MSAMNGMEFFIDHSRCIGCKACVQACEECDTHRGVSMIHLETIMRVDSVQTAPQVCMHCEDPICAQVCPADAIKKTEDGVVLSSLKPRCIGCSNCVLACPFGVPKYRVEINQMMKCDMCYDRNQHWQASYVCDCMPVWRPCFYHPGADRPYKAGERDSRVDVW